MTTPNTDDSQWDTPDLLARLDAHLASIRRDAAPPAVDGYRLDQKGRLVPESMVAASDQLMDETARKIAAFAHDLACQIARFREHSYGDLGALLSILESEHGVRRPGRRKGSYSIMSFDGRVRVTLQMSDRIEFGPELQVARTLVDECLESWTADTRPEVRALLEHAFQTDKEGTVSREAVFRLRRLDIPDERWQRVRGAIDASIRVTSQRTYLRVHVRSGPDGKWMAIPIDIAADWQPGCR